MKTKDIIPTFSASCLHQTVGLPLLVGYKMLSKNIVRKDIPYFKERTIDDIYSEGKLRAIKKMYYAVSSPCFGIYVPTETLTVDRVAKCFAEKRGYQIGADSPYDILEWLWDLYFNGNDNAISENYADKSYFYSTSNWKKLREFVFRYYGKHCMVCFKTNDICVDHIYPRRIYLSLELDFCNMQVLCSN